MEQAHDPSGNITYDSANQYLYDAEGRICAIRNLTVGIMTGYLYDAEGPRVGKGSISTFPAPGATCAAPTAANGFTLTASYVPGLGGEQLSELDGSGNWKHTNVFSGGKLLATYDSTSSGVFFALNDWLGTKRAEVGTIAPSGCLSSYFSLPYGSALAASGSCPDATEHHFTGKERDTESGNDYFGARYYASAMGRFMSPDPVKITGKRLVDPQRLILYGYARNNPLSYVDDDGKDIHIVVTNSVVGESRVNRYTKAEMRANPELKQYTEKVPTYRVFLFNDSGHARMIEATRDSVRNGTASDTRGSYGTGNETPPGSYSAATKDNGVLGFRTEISDKPGTGIVMGPDGERDNLQMHIGPGASEGCMTIPGGASGRDDYQTKINDLLGEDRSNGLGTNMYETVQDRNNALQTESIPVNTQIEEQPLQQFKP